MRGDLIQFGRIYAGGFIVLFNRAKVDAHIKCSIFSQRYQQQFVAMIFQSNACVIW
jgi:hypothetical protein